LVKHGMVARERHGLLTHIQSFNRLGSSKRGMNTKRSGMRKYLEHLPACREPFRRDSILSLIAEPTSFLPAFDIDEKLRGPLVDIDHRRATSSKKSFLRRQPFQHATLGIVPQIHSRRSGFLTQEIGQHVFPAVHTGGQSLHNQYVVITIHDKTGNRSSSPLMKRLAMVTVEI